MSKTLFSCVMEPKYGGILVTLTNNGQTVQWLEQDRCEALDEVFRRLEDDEEN